MDKPRSVNDFEVLARLGEGAFGQVFKVKRKEDGEIYAMKKITTVTMKQKDRANALNEIRILASMVNQHIIGYKESFYDEGSANLCIVLEFAGQGDITRKINQYSKKKKFIEEAEIWKAMVHISKGIRTLHDSNILHRDLKSANIFITQDGTYKLGDLNISKVLKQGLARTQTGTPYYCSPEVWQDKPYGAKSDIWSFGCVLYEMAAQKPPFTASDIQGLYRKVCAGVFPRIPNIYSNQLSDMINSMLKLNPSLRPSTHDILKNAIVQRNFKGQKDFEPISKSAMLLQTIPFNNKGWKNINSNLPKSQYQIECNQQEEVNYDNNLKVPNNIRVSRPVSSKSGQIKNRSTQKQNHQEETPTTHHKRQRVMSAYGKRNINGSELSTPERKEEDIKKSVNGSRRGSVSKANNNLVLPPIDPSSKRSRRGSDNYDQILMPPRPEQKRDTSRGNSADRNNSANGSRQKLQKAGKQIVNSPNIRIKVVDSPQSNRYY